MSHHAEMSQQWHRDALDEQADEEVEPMITVLLVNDEAIVREGLKMRLALEADMTIVGEASTGAEALEQVQRIQPDIVLMDLALPDMDGIASSPQAKCGSHLEPAR
jgi:DNA-binding NarL/FixJ family response regulator